MRPEGFEGQAKVSEESCVSEETQASGEVQFLKIVMFLEGFRLLRSQRAGVSKSTSQTVV